MSLGLVGVVQASREDLALRLLQSLGALWLESDESERRTIMLVGSKTLLIKVGLRGECYLHVYRALRMIVRMGNKVDSVDTAILIGEVFGGVIGN
ncbi:hypothetical protein Tco_1360229 [Tanacetum coccineum]